MSVLSPSIPLLKGGLGLSIHAIAVLRGPHGGWGRHSRAPCYPGVLGLLHFERASQTPFAVHFLLIPKSGQMVQFVLVLLDKYLALDMNTFDSCVAGLRQHDAKFFGKDYLLTWDLKQNEVESVALTARALECLFRNNISCRAFDTGLGVSNFRDQSTRTRFAFASACDLLGLTVADFDESKSQVAHGETTRETAAMVSFLTEVIGIRDDLFIHEGHEYQVEVAESVKESFKAGVLPQRPAVVNLQCDRDHPTQSMSDLMHLANYFGNGDLESLKGRKIAVSWAYSPSYGKPLSVPQGLITLLTRFGMDVTLAYPEGYDLLPETMTVAERFAAESGGSFKHVTSMAEAFEGAEVVYPKSWAPFTVMEQRTALLRQGAAGAAAMEQLEQEALERNLQHLDWECTEEMMALTGKGGKEATYMHCLPADITGVSCERGEVAASVFERHRLATYAEASHKSYVIAASILLGRFPDVPALLEGMRDKPRARLASSSPSKAKTPELLRGISWPTGLPEHPLDAKVAQLATKYTDLACEFLREAVRIPADDTGNEMAGTSNHEGPRLAYLQSMLVKHGCVERPEDAWIDEFGNLVWQVQNTDDGVPVAEKKVIYFDGHTDTVAPLPAEWQRKIGGGIDVHKGLIDADKVDQDFLRQELGYLPPKEEWKHLIFGRGSADQLSGVVAQMVATKIMLELRAEGALDGVVVRSYGTVAEEDNDGGGPMYVMREVCPKEPEMIPDVVVHSEGTGDKDTSACGIYIGQRGRMQIEVEIVGKSSHGSMPWEGLNPLEFGSAILKEAQQQATDGKTFKYDEFLGAGSRTASWCDLSTPSDCAVPANFVFRFDRRLTVNETPEQAVNEIKSLPSVQAAVDAGLTVDVRVPEYTNKTWTGYTPGNSQIYMGWLTPPQHEAVQTAYDTWRRTVSLQLLRDDSTPRPSTTFPKEPRVSRWIFSTDGVGFPVPKEGKQALKVAASKKWVEQGPYHHPAQIGIGIGYEQNTHKIGEFIDKRHFPAAIAFMARFPGLYRSRTTSK